MDSPIFLDTDGKGGLIISQYRQDCPESRVVLTSEQVTGLVDMLLGPKRVQHGTIDLSKLVENPEKQN